ncbi:hypothetical protein AUJ46_00490 [Candidatus Peregrinibacteria bacterium CG1_02_54_53]|nr:MAG: hypothetical protein AUJ46_00490 [Candidatus Peregrinibacteria bacterium CG1_02_54_53]
MAENTTPTEQEILSFVRQAKEGDTQAFERLYDYFFPQVYRYAAFRFDTEMAEDLVADVFLKVWEKLHTYQERKGVPFAAWLFRIARYEVIDAYRSKREIAEMPEDLHDPDEMNHADHRVKRSETLAMVRAAMDKLPRRYRDILLLSYMADLPHSEIARTLKMREGAVRVLKFRALEKLEALLPPEAHGML